MNLAEGGVEVFPDGRKVTVEPNANRVYACLWPNGAIIEVLFYVEKQQGEHDSDRIELLITDNAGQRRDWIMNASDAVCIIEGLSCAIRLCLEAGIPACAAEGEGT